MSDPAVSVPGGTECRCESPSGFDLCWDCGGSLNAAVSTEPRPENPDAIIERLRERLIPLDPEFPGGTPVVHLPDAVAAVREAVVAERARIVTMLREHQELESAPMFLSDLLIDLIERSGGEGL